MSIHWENTAVCRPSLIYFACREAVCVKTEKGAFEKKFTTRSATGTFPRAVGQLFLYFAWANLVENEPANFASELKKRAYRPRNRLYSHKRPPKVHYIVFPA
jgi:hypothetical protein